MTQFNALGLAAPILKSIETEGFTEPTPIQSMSIPALMEGHDLMGIAHTGGGKTASFALPMLHKLLENPSKPLPNTTKALILAPTRELAQQIGQCVSAFSRGTKLTHLVIAGGLPYGPQIQKLRRGVDVLIATPGRLMDHVGRGGITFDETHTYVLDEADRMLDMGFINDVMDISRSLPKEHQTVLFSATMNPKIRKLSQALLNDPVHVEIEQKTSVAETIDHKMMTVAGTKKRELLFELLSKGEMEKVLVFTRTKRGADKLAIQLSKQGVETDAIHGDKRQRVREKILRNFKNGRIRVLVATDLAARGIDVDGISHVINYELPVEPENYVHRVGRTGRAGNKGIALSFCTTDDVDLLLAIENLIKLPIEVDADHEFHVDVPKKVSGGSKKKGAGRGGRRGAGRSSNGGGRSFGKPSFGKSSFSKSSQGRNSEGRSANGKARTAKKSNWSPADKHDDDGDVRFERKRAGGQKTSGRRDGGQRNDGQRTDGQRAEGYNADGRNGEGQRGSKRRAEGKRSDNQRNEQQRAEGSKSGGKFAGKKRGDAKSASGAKGGFVAKKRGAGGEKSGGQKFTGGPKKRSRPQRAA